MKSNIGSGKFRVVRGRVFHAKARRPEGPMARRRVTVTKLADHLDVSRQSMSNS